MNKFLHDYHAAAEECATYVFESESEQISYEEYIQSGGDPRDHIIYHAAIVLGKQSEFQTDIDEYDKNPNYSS